jgi:D-arginine dehydrogenase
LRACYDVVVIGAGLIGASAAYRLSEHFSTVLLEQESAPGYHSSGRSAAVLLPPYGGPLARALTAASAGFLSAPPPGFCNQALVSPRGALFIAGEEQLFLLEKWRAETYTGGGEKPVLTFRQALEHVPILRPERAARAVLLPEVVDIDAAALLQGFIRGLRANGGDILLNARVTSISRVTGNWVLESAGGEVSARTLVNAAGAWADQVGEMAGVRRKGLVPTRRTMVLTKVPQSFDIRSWPLVADAAESFYFKPDAGRLAVSPGDNTVVEAQDILPDDLDVAVAIDRLERATTLEVSKLEGQWAGLRTFAPDEEPIVGFDPEQPDFLWAAGFGGFGVQACVAAGLCCEALVRRLPVSTRLEDLAVDLKKLSPTRLGAAPPEPRREP